VIGMPTRPIVIAHRGASGYLPEHTLAAKTLAVGMGADYLEQDVVASRDGELLVFHDLTLEQTTDVAERFPGRARADGSFYCIDFDLAELRALRVRARRDATGAVRYPGRFPDEAGHFGIVTLEEELALVAGLGRSTGRRIGIYPEIKEPAFHRAAGLDPGARLLETLDRHGYRSAEDPVFVQCFDDQELARLRNGFGCRLRLVQLIDGSAPVPGAEDLAGIAAYADAIGPSLRLVCPPAGDGKPAPTTLVRDAHAAGLAVHPYTLRRDDLAPGFTSLDALLEVVFLQLGADGAFTDFPDLVVAFLRARLAG
jgi:glycerophosphoryl diester phosphodiesterase